MKKKPIVKKQIPFRIIKAIRASYVVAPNPECKGWYGLYPTWAPKHSLACSSSLAFAEERRRHYIVYDLNEIQRAITLLESHGLIISDALQTKREHEINSSKSS